MNDARSPIVGRRSGNGVVLKVRGLEPRVRRMAMSARLSVTVITSVETRLKAATATISVRMMNISRFSN